MQISSEEEAVDVPPLRRWHNAGMTERLRIAVIGYGTAGQALAMRYAPRLRLIEGRFGDMAELLSAEGVDDVDALGTAVEVQMNRKCKDGKIASDTHRTFERQLCAGRHRGGVEPADRLTTIMERRPDRILDRRVERIDRGDVVGAAGLEGSDIGVDRCFHLHWVGHGVTPENNG